MRRKNPSLLLLAALMALLGSVTLPGMAPRGKKKKEVVDQNDPTYRLFELLNSSYEGKLPDIYLLADVFTDPANPDQEFQHVLRVSYDKDRAYGTLEIHVRTVAKLGPEQLKTYSPKDVYDFGSYDTEKFMKSEVGPFGQTGDDFLMATANKPLMSAPVTDDVRKTYDTFITQYILPALQKKQQTP